MFTFKRRTNPDRPKATDYPLEQRGIFRDPGYLKQLKEQHPDLPPAWQLCCDAPKCKLPLTSMDDLALATSDSNVTFLHHNRGCAVYADATTRNGQPVYHPSQRSTVGELFDAMMDQFTPAVEQHQSEAVGA